MQKNCKSEIKMRNENQKLEIKMKIGNKNQE